METDNGPSGAWQDGYEVGDSVVVALIHVDSTSYRYAEATVLSKGPDGLLLQPREGKDRWNVKDALTAARLGLHRGTLTGDPAEE